MLKQSGIICNNSLPFLSIFRIVTGLSNLSESNGGLSVSGEKLSPLPVSVCVTLRISGDIETKMEKKKPKKKSRFWRVFLYLCRFSPGPPGFPPTPSRGKKNVC